MLTISSSPRLGRGRSRLPVPKKTSKSSRIVNVHEIENLNFMAVPEQDHRPNIDDDPIQPPPPPPRAPSLDGFLFDLPTNANGQGVGGEDSFSKAKIAALEHANGQLAAELGKCKAILADHQQASLMATDSAGCGLPQVQVFGRNTIRKLQADASKKEQDLATAHEQVKSLQEERDQFRHDLATANDKAAVLQKTLEDVQAQARADQERFTSLHEATVATVHASADEYHKKIIAEIKTANTTVIATLQAECDEYKTKVATQQVTMDELNQIVAMANDKIATLESSVQEKDAVIAETTTVIAGLQAAVEAKEMELAAKNNIKHAPTFLETMTSPFPFKMHHHHKDHGSSSLSSAAPMPTSAMTARVAGPPDFFSPIPRAEGSPISSKVSVMTNIEDEEAMMTVPGKTETTMGSSPLVLSEDKENKAPDTPMPYCKKSNNKKNPLSMLQSMGGSIRRSARKAVKTDRFSPDKI